MNKKELKKKLNQLNDIIKTFATNIYPVQVTPLNILNFEEAFNNFIAREGDTGNDFIFKLKFSCKKDGQIVVEHIEAFNNGVKVMG